MTVTSPYWPLGAGPIQSAAVDDTTPALFTLTPGTLYSLSCLWTEPDTAVVGKLGGYNVVASAADAHFSLGIRHFHFFTPRPGYNYLSVISISGANTVYLHAWTPNDHEGWWVKQQMGIASAPVVIDVGATASAGVALTVGNIYRISANVNLALRLGPSDVAAAVNNAHYFFHAVYQDLKIETGYDYISAIAYGAQTGRLYLAPLTPSALPPNREMHGVVSQFDSPQPVPFMGEIGTPSVVTYSSILSPTRLTLTIGHTYSITQASQYATDEAVLKFGDVTVTATAADAHFVLRNRRLILKAMPSYNYLSVQGLDAENKLYVAEVI